MLSAEQSPLSVVALIPMRHDSERVPGKNYRELAGLPLYAHILNSLARCPSISQIAVDTDSPVIREGLETGFPSVRLIERPEALRGGDVPMNSILRHDVDQIASPFYLQTHSTNPLLRPETIERSIRQFAAAYPRLDSLFSVTARRLRYWTVDAHPVKHDPQMLERTQDMQPLYEENSCIYIFERQTFKQSGNRIGRRPLLFEIDPLEAWDIDTESDWTVAECILKNNHGRM